jgi:outer membrane protein assembly factor BamE
MWRLPVSACSFWNRSRIFRRGKVALRPMLFRSQGNFVTQEMVAQLKPGLSREQVRFILGSPLIADMFHGNRWDYVYSYKQGHGEAQQRTLTVFFQDNKLTRVAGDVVAEDPATAEAPKSATRVIDIPGPAAVAAPAGADKQEKK